MRADSRDVSEHGLRETQISDRVVVWTLGGDTILTSWGANCTAIIGDRAVLLVDPLIAPAHARLVERALGRRTPLPVSHVLLTHHHTDHALGSSYFAARGAEVVAHRRCAERMEAEHPDLVASRRSSPETAALFSDADPQTPQRVFDDEVRIDLGGIFVRVTHPGHGHTPGDAIAWLPVESVAICGDLVSSGYHVNMEDASPRGVVAALAVLAALGARTYVPGHGPAGGSERIDEQRAYHRAVERTVQDGLAAGLSERTIASELAGRFPGLLLPIVLPAAVACWRDPGHPAGGFATIGG